MKPLSPYILIEPIEGVKISGIIIPETAKEKPQEGKVIAVNEESKLKVGDVVIFKKWEVTEIDKMYLIKEENILAIR